MSAPLKTAILHYSAPPVIGGVEAVIQSHAQMFAESGYPLAVIAGRGSQDALPAPVEYVEVAEIDSQHPQILDLTRRLEEGSLPADFDRMVEKLVALLRPLISAYDRLIVHNVFTKQFNIPLTAALFYMLDFPGLPHMVSWVHDITWTSPYSRSKMHPGYPWDLLKTYDARISWVAVSNQRRQELAGLFARSPEIIEVIYNGVDPYRLLGISPEGRTLIERLKLFESDLILLMPVRVTRRKNIEYAMQVLASLKEPDFHPTMILTGPPDPHSASSMEYFRELLELRADLGVEKEMVFVYQSGPDSRKGYHVGAETIGDLLRVSDLLFMPSQREGFGMPVLEAGLAGIPVFTSRVPAAVEIGAEDVHWVEIEAPPGETARQIAHWAKNDPVYRLRRKSRQQYTWKAIFECQILPLLEKGSGY